MSFALTHQSKNKTGESTTSMHARPSTSHSINNLAMDSIGYLQRTIGNQASQRLARSNVGFDFAKIAIQPRLKINQRGDVYEQEADRIAERIMRMPITVALHQLPLQKNNK
jgi:hypothetical protein